MPFASNDSRPGSPFSPPRPSFPSSSASASCSRPSAASCCGQVRLSRKSSSTTPSAAPTLPFAQQKAIRSPRSPAIVSPHTSRMWSLLRMRRRGVRRADRLAMAAMTTTSCKSTQRPAGYNSIFRTSWRRRSCCTISSPTSTKITVDTCNLSIRTSSKARPAAHRILRAANAILSEQRPSQTARRRPIIHVV